MAERAPGNPAPDVPARPVERLLTPREASRILGVDPKTLIRWEGEGRLMSLRTLGGHRRYPRTLVEQMAVPVPPLEEVVSTLRQVHDRALEIGAREEAATIARLMAVLDAEG
ncbi:MerR family DNA-binding transcriptional regulator [Nocardiopsis sp. CA-288880]|uniref:MerR family DNA-binding transcriptional regulator n=1 Tax=Nocardiopsis sp. CA-288880 TaxID=3239995 RepID=UPI003D998690